MRLSIIIPVYNAQDYLSACIDSCLNQSNAEINKDYEIICVNDGSKDNSLKILRSYEKEYGIRVHDKQNSGVSDTRNVGLSLAKGDYIWFVDSDDCIHPDSFVIMDNVLGMGGVDGFVFEIIPVGQDFSVKSISTLKKQSIQTEEFSASFGNPVCVVTKREYLLKYNIRFKVGMLYGEDTLWAFWCLLYPHNYVYADVVLYYYRQNPNSAMHRKDITSRRKWLYSMIMMLEEYKHVLDKWSPEMLESKHQETKDRFDWSVQNVMFGALRMPREECQDIWRTLIERGYYPYKMQWNRLRGSIGIGDLKVNAFCLLFPYRWYYKLLVKLLTK